MLVFMQSRRSLKQGSRVAVGAETEQDQIETRQRIVLELEELAQGLLVGLRGSIGIRNLRWDAEDIFLGNWSPGKQRLAGHAEIALRAIRRDVALVAEEEANLVPRHIRLCGQQGIETSRRRAA